MTKWDDLREAADEARIANIWKIVSRYQFKMALKASNKLAQFKTALASASDGTQLYFADANNISRNSAAVTEIAAALGLTSTQVDNFFQAASQVGE